MKEVKLSKVTENEIQVLQTELHHYAELQKLGFNFISTEEFVNALLITDIAFRMWLTFRKKIESEKETCTVRLKLSEAVILFKCCHWERDGRNQYSKHVAEKFKNVIDQQLKSLVTT